MQNFTEKDATTMIKGKLSRYFGVSPKEATKNRSTKLS